jgi:hypothetical protein
MNCFHPSDLGQTLALAPAFAPRGAGHLGDEDRGYGVANHAPGSGLVRRQAGQIGQIGTSAPTPATSCRAGDGVKASVAEGLATDPAEAIFSMEWASVTHIRGRSALQDRRFACGRRALRPQPQRFLAEIALNRGHFGPCPGPRSCNGINGVTTSAAAAACERGGRQVVGTVTGDASGWRAAASRGRTDPRST